MLNSFRSRFSLYRDLTRFTICLMSLMLVIIGSFNHISSSSDRTSFRNAPLKSTCLIDPFLVRATDSKALTRSIKSTGPFRAISSPMSSIKFQSAKSRTLNLARPPCSSHFNFSITIDSSSLTSFWCFSFFQFPFSINILSFSSIAIMHSTFLRWC